jgi:hypothetical protein
MNDKKRKLVAYHEVGFGIGAGFGSKFGRVGMRSTLGPSLSHRQAAPSSRRVDPLQPQISLFSLFRVPLSFSLSESLSIPL